MLLWPRDWTIRFTFKTRGRNNDNNNGNIKLNDHAQEWAENLAKEGLVTQRTLMPYGENVYVGSGRKIRAEQPVDCWYREGRYYKYGVERPRNLKDACNFAQLVWRDTKSMGLGMATGPDGKIYFVCNYEPIGNIVGEYANNVLPPKEEEMELLPFEEVGIRFIEPRVDIVESMERLYAVPSEKLRVWSIWLTKIGEIADEWQSWLRAHIDIAIRLGDRLQAAQTAITGAELEAREKSNDVYSEDTYTTANEEIEYLEESDESPQGQARTNAQDVNGISAVGHGEPGTPLAEEMEGNNEARSAVSAPEDIEAIETPVMPDEGTSPVETTNFANDPSELSVRSSNAEIGEDEKGEESVEESAIYPLESGASWPVGRPWKPLGSSIAEEADKGETPRVLAMPGDETEMLQFIKDFTHRATIYRSYYEHWRATAEQAIKEIDGRTVMSTAKVRGWGERVRSDGLDLQASPSRSALDGKSAKTDVPAAAPISTHDRDPTETTIVGSTLGSDVEPTSEMSGQGATTEPTAEPTTESTAENDVPESSTTEPTEENEIDPGVTPPAPEQGESGDREKSAEESKGQREVATIKSTTVRSKTSDAVAELVEERPIAESADVEASIRDEARADEDIPYFFYLKSEPDIEIAIEHNDEKVIPPDPDRESVTGNYKRLYFNLTDKPGKGGKPWL